MKNELEQGKCVSPILFDRYSRMSWLCVVRHVASEQNVTTSPDIQASLA